MRRGGPRRALAAALGCCIALAVSSCGGTAFTTVGGGDAGGDGTLPDGAVSDAGGDVTRPPGCPATQPQGACTGNLSCPYECTTCTCDNGQWVCPGRGCAAGCPSTVPQQGSACGGCCGPSVGVTCEYPCSGGGGGTFKATCDGTGLNGTWNLGTCGPTSTPGKVVCGTTQCDLSSGQACCDVQKGGSPSTHTCGAISAGSFCMTGAIQECDEKADCTGGNVCCIEFLSQGISAQCMPSCITGAPRYQACASSAECEGGGTCATYTCPGNETVNTCEKPSSSSSCQ